MLALGLDIRRPLSILCLGAHCDDIEIGCAGTLITILAARPAAVHWVVFSGDAVRRAEATASAAALLAGAAARHIAVHDFRESFFPGQGMEIKEVFEKLKADCRPDVVFTHHKNDHHQDHRVVAELTWNTFRDHLVLEYEIPKYEGDLGNPNLFVPISRAVAERKVDGLLAGFSSQRRRSWFTADTFMALLRLRGVNANAASGLAEGFHCRKLVLSGG